MSQSPQKDFGPIADDYAFFEAHATEAEQDARAHAAHLPGVGAADGPVRVLDFGCGSGGFTARFLAAAGWPPSRVELTLVEPVESARRRAVARLTPCCAAAPADRAALPPGRAGCFDVVLANHSLYYVRDLKQHLADLLAALADAGVLLAAIAGRANALIDVWAAGFGLLGRPIPYHVAEDVESALAGLGADYATEHVLYELAFPDTPENRLRIIRFLLADHLAAMPLNPLLALFDRYSRGGRVEIPTGCEHFAARRKPA